MTEHLYFSLTQYLLSNATAEFEKATQSPFLLAAAQGRLDKKNLRTWLINDRKYIHSYIIGAETMVEELQKSPGGADGKVDENEVALCTWLTEGVANVRREEQFFVDIAARYGIDLTPRADDGEPPDAVLIFDTLFKYVPLNLKITEPRWLQTAVLFWATEKCYLEAWSWAKKQLNDQSPQKDADGGALRTEFIPNWTTPEFAVFVDRLAHIIDEAVNKMSKDIEDNKEAIPQRVREVLELSFEEKSVEFSQKIFMAVLKAEEQFWPVLD